MRQWHPAPPELPPARFTVLIECLPHFGNVKLPGGSLNQSHAQPFQLRNNAGSVFDFAHQVRPAAANPPFDHMHTNQF